MKTLKRVKRGEPVTADAYNALVDYIVENQILQIIGTQERRSPKGRVVSLPRIPPASGATTEPGGDPKILGCVHGAQDTDTYDSAEDPEQLVQVTVVVDAIYTEATRKFELVYRTLTIPAKLVTAESADNARTLVFEAEICEEV